MTDPELLPLRDIHLPASPGWWPPAPGWWLLLCLLTISIIVWILWRRHRERLRLSAINLAREELSAIQEQFTLSQDAKSTVQAVSVLLRRLSISLFPRQDAAGLTGEDWLAFLDAQITQKIFSQGAGQVMLEAPYRRDVERAQAESLLTVCQQWIEAVSATQQVGRP